MSRHFTRNRVPFDHAGTGKTLGHVPATPVGLGETTGKRVEIFNAEELRAARQTKRWAPYLPFADRPAGVFDAAPRIAHGTKGSVATRAVVAKPVPQVYPELVRPFAPGQEDALAALNGLRGSVEAILRQRGITPLTQRPSTMGGAVILESAAVQAAQRLTSLEGVSSEKIMERVVREQPPSASRPAGIVRAKISFNGPAKNQPRTVALQLTGKGLRAETEAAMDSVQNETLTRLGNPGALVMLAVGNRAIPPAVREEIAAKAVQSGVLTTPMQFEPSPLINQLQAPAAPAAAAPQA